MTSPAKTYPEFPASTSSQRTMQCVLDRCDRLAECTERSGEITRLGYSRAMSDAHREVAAWMCAAGLEVRLDPAGNLIGRRPSSSGVVPARVVLIGSHLDSVVNAGKYDGVLGVMLGLALAELLQSAGLELPFALDVVAFSEEEGVRFATPYLGSRALVGELTNEILGRHDVSGCSLRDALRSFGGDPDRLADAEYAQQDVLAYIEPHIEQGPVLEQQELPVGVVTGIAGQTRAGITFLGRAGHAGTVPMTARRDALAAAAQWITAVENIGRNHEGLVATVGKIETWPNVGNVVPGEVRLVMDVRHLDDAVRRAACEKILARAAAIRDERDLTHVVTWMQQEPTVPCHQQYIQMLSQAVTESGVKPYCLPSGAGHDAAVLSRRFPVCMLFLRCRGGVSHHPDEYVAPADVHTSLEVLWRFLMKLAVAESL